jgi:ketosteroid isomerase-like protein
MPADLATAMSDFQRVVEGRDVAGAADVLDEAYALVLVQPEPATVPRQQWLAMLPDYVVHDYAVEASTIDEDGDLAVVLHRDRMEATVLGQPRNGTFVITDVWRRRADGWRLWRRHSTPLSAGPMPS